MFKKPIFPLQMDGSQNIAFSTTRFWRCIGTPSKRCNNYYQNLDIRCDVLDIRVRVATCLIYNEITRIDFFKSTRSIAIFSKDHYILLCQMLKYFTLSLQYF